MKFNIHTHKSSGTENVLEIVNQYPNEFDSAAHYFSIGIHPWYINLDRVEADLAIIEAKLQDPNCLALGECGLDKRIETSLEIQTQIFEKQVILAKKYKKPVILHCVSAYQEVIEIRKRMNIEVPMIIHGFSKNIQVAQSLLDHGFCLSFGKYLLRNPELASVFEKVPNDKFFLETDTIEETIFEVYAKASEIKNINIEIQVEENFLKVFDLKR
ncbi:TatD family deoxyribonuclease [Flavobacterium amnicola]|uniref:TatD family deoxyribonuclease n=1 Tax=Flavobacterium amnicola TaxID=2506422 RepID=A0A4Q1K2P7_9FLAO|nr:TatD family hydrolase [Flavobacterium amnicola]RXR19323.1 TatD family deoxyribonuclease [Flavobacterium amnicola]